VPASTPPHKALSDDPGPALRLEMLRASIEAEPGFAVADCEIDREGISYSIDTIRYLSSSGLVEPRPFLVIGDDLVEGFPSWKEYASILEESRILIIHRSSAARLKPDFPHSYLDNSIFPLSSSLVRSRIASGGAWKFLVTAETRELIEKHGLYGLR
jgi:nicotinate-nucleotide adenylyltransferase